MTSTYIDSRHQVLGGRLEILNLLLHKFGFVLVLLNVLLLLVNGLHEAVDLLVVEATGAGPRGDRATAATSGTHRPLEVDLQNRRSQGFFQEVLRDADKNFISFLYGSRHFKRGNHI